MRRFLVVVLGFVFCLQGGADAATLFGYRALPKYFPWAEKSAIIHVIGTIELGDDLKFKKIVEELVLDGYWIDTVAIYSNGGRLEPSIKIGEIINRLNITTTAPSRFKNTPRWRNHCFINRNSGPHSFERDVWTFDARKGAGRADCNCASACFFIWAAGVSKDGNVVGVHRPFFDPTHYASLDGVTAKRRYEELMERAKSYLGRMKVPSSLVDRLFATSSTEMFYLSEADISLMRREPYREEMVIARCGREEETSESYLRCRAGVLRSLFVQAYSEYAKAN